MNAEGTASEFRDARQDIDVDTPTEAQRMADDFIRCRTLTGLSKQEILRVLGRPDGTSATPQIHLGDAQYDYYLGAVRSYISIGSETLELRFGSDRTVGHVAIYRDRTPRAKRTTGLEPATFGLGSRGFVALGCGIGGGCDWDATLTESLVSPLRQALA